MERGSGAPRSDLRRVAWVVGTPCFLAAVALILAAARGSLWFDEVWSMQLAEQCRGPLDVLARHFDNNHVLNTLYLWALGPKLVSDYPYRLLSVACGIATLGVLAWIASRRAAIDGLFALVLAGSCYPLVLYWSEARGYAPAMLCAVLAFAILRSTWTRLGPGRVLAFWITLALGVLAHVTFVIPTFALMVAALVHEIRSGAAWWRRVGRLVALFAVPLGFFTWFYVVFVREMRIVGGPVLAYRDVVETAAAMLLGMPAAGAWRFVAVVGCLSVVGAATVVVWRRRPEEGVFYPAAFLVGPFGLLAVSHPQELYFRYFVVVFPFFILALAELLGVACGGRPARCAAAAVLVVAPWLVGNGQRLVPLLRYHRGDDRGALQYASTHSPPGDLYIGCDSETGVLLTFYAHLLPPGQTLRMVPFAKWRTERPAWVTTRSLRTGYEPPLELELTEDLRYLRVMDYRHGGSSGWTTFLWRREDAADDAAMVATNPSHD
jgi:hypothetical protein